MFHWMAGDARQKVSEMFRRHRRQALLIADMVNMR